MATIQKANSGNELTSDEIEVLLLQQDYDKLIKTLKGNGRSDSPSKENGLKIRNKYFEIHLTDQNPEMLQKMI